LSKAIESASGVAPGGTWNLVLGHQGSQDALLRVSKVREVERARRESQPAQVEVLGSDARDDLVVQRCSTFAWPTQRDVVKAEVSIAGVAQGRDVVNR
jgi:hypothetical protein